MKHQIIFDTDVELPEGVEEQFRTVITAALEAEGFIRMRARSGNVINGLKLSPQSSDPRDEFPDFLA